jgi:molybdopterin-guanine dinucleotide biosynthesis protein A
MLGDREASRGPGGGILAVALAGGRSSRFGRDKALACFEGEPLLGRVLAALEDHLALSRRALSRRAIVANDPAPYAALAERYGALLLRDHPPERGPLGGLVTALREAERGAEAAILALACDMPQIEAEAIEALLSAARRHPEAAIVGVAGGRRHPLFAHWPVAALPILEARLASGQLSLLGALEALEAAPGPALEVIELPISEQSATNINRPEQLEALAEGSKSK